MVRAAAVNKSTVLTATTSSHSVKRSNAAAGFRIAAPRISCLRGRNLRGLRFGQFHPRERAAADATVFPARRRTASRQQGAHPEKPRKRVLVVDIGGSSVKILATGHKLRRSFPSGPKMTPKQMVSGVKKLAKDWV